MKWEKVKQKYPDQWVKLKILDSSIIGKKKVISDMKVIHSIEDGKKAARELGSCKDDEVVFHTSNEKIVIEIKDMFGFRMVH